MNDVPENMSRRVKNNFDYRQPIYLVSHLLFICCLNIYLVGAWLYAPVDAQHRCKLRVESMLASSSGSLCLCLLSAAEWNDEEEC